MHEILVAALWDTLCLIVYVIDGHPVPEVLELRLPPLSESVITQLNNIRTIVALEELKGSD